MSQVATELGISLPLALLDQRCRNLAGIPSGSVNMLAMLGATKFTLAAGTGGGFNGWSFGGGFGSLSPANFNSVQVVAIVTNGTVLIVDIAGSRAQSFFKAISLTTGGSNIYLTANAAVFTDLGSISRWQWNTSEDYVNGVGYTPIIV